MGSFHALGCTVALSAILLPAARARAAGVTPEERPGDPRRACLAQHDAAPVLTRADMLTEARAALAACSKGACPVAIRAECAESFEALTASIPSVIVSATSHDQDEDRVRVIVDGEVVPLRRDGRPLEFNPGLHRFRFEAPAQEPVERQVLLVRGEKYRVLSVRFEHLKGAPPPEPARRPEPAPPPQVVPLPEPAPASKPAPPVALAPRAVPSPLPEPAPASKPAPPVARAQPPAPAPPPEPVSLPEPSPAQTPSAMSAPGPVPSVPSTGSSRPVPVLDYVLGASALVGIAGVAGFGLWGLNERQSLESTCSPFCSDSQLSAVRSKLVAADIAMGVAVLSILGGAYVYVTRPTVERKETAGGGPLGVPRAGATLALAPIASGAVLRLEGDL